jgi:hypothetical protein
MGHALQYHNHNVNRPHIKHIDQILSIDIGQNFQDI